MANDPAHGQEHSSLQFDDFITMSAEDVLHDRRPSREENNRSKKAVEKVVRALQKLGPARVVKGGSYGKGTHVRNRYEVDIVILLQDFKKEDMEGKLSAMREALASIGKDLMVRSHSLKMVVTEDSYDIKFDILPGEYVGDDEDCIREIGSSQTGHDHTLDLSSSKLQVDFVKHQDAKYKDLVRYCKVWRDTFSWPDGSWPKSFLLELLALGAYEKGTPSIDIAFDDFLSMLQSSNLKLAWSRWYDADEALQQGCFKQDDRIILDPANPTNNVARSCKNWDLLKSRALETQGGIKALAASIKGVFKLLRTHVADLESKVKVLEPWTTFARHSTRKVEFDVSKLSVASAGGELNSPTFSAGGVPDMNLCFKPKGTETESRDCGLYLYWPAGTLMKFELFVDGNKVGHTVEFNYSTRIGHGFNRACSIKPSYSTVGLCILQAGFAEPGKGISFKLERAVYGQDAALRVTWDISKLSSLPKGECHTSAKFTTAACPGLCITFYPKGTANATSGCCSCYLHAPAGSYIRAKFFMDGISIGDDSETSYSTGQFGYEGFFRVKSSYDNVGVLIFSGKYAHTGGNLRMYRGDS